ncbi:PAS domain-containing protein [Allosphingosinicella flava]|uniref:histidine kinase n=1 Tax=Allosphingosinicella flava TaxID=2771430 RepID=A0A7T2GIP3_9SPHN|nr:HWE histidine kinase domain-containing protein [Sphingosinicella flava]QPQ54616.1 PAS domain-containing protein [Sphingosinicella flava]
MTRTASPQVADTPGGMRERIRLFDWASTPLGPREAWPEPLRFAVNLCEHSSMPTAVYWGRELRLIYNDAWLPMAGDRHPWALGRPAREVWAEIWAEVGPQFDQVCDTGEGLSATEALIPLVRNGAVRETYWTYSLTPLIGDNDRVLGVLSQGNDVTRTVIAEKRLSYQVTLADALRESMDPGEVKSIAARMLGTALGVARSGYAEVNDDRQAFLVNGDWTRDASIQSFAGQGLPVDAFGTEARAWLDAGNILTVNDLSAQPHGGMPFAVALRKIGVASAIVVPLVRQGVMHAALYVQDIVPRLWKGSDVAIARDTAERTWDAVERARSEQSLRENEDHYRHAIELSPYAFWTALPDGGPINRMSGRWVEWTGTSGLNDDWALAMHPDDREPTFAARDESLRTSRPFDMEHRVRMRDKGYRWVRSRAYPRYGADGKPCLWYGVMEDVDARHRAEEHQSLLINELNHRVKNTLATVQAIASQTLKGDLPLPEARSRFEARLLALSRAHNLLTEQNWEGAPIWRVVADSLAHLSSEKGRFRLDGEPLWLTPRAALALALACHELSTNAVKYGALSTEQGHVDVRWRIEGDMIRIEWRERDGPPVSRPAARGFGSRLIERGLAGDLNGRAQLEFNPDGLICTIEAPLSAVLAREGERNGR